MKKLIQLITEISGGFLGMAVVILYNYVFSVSTPPTPLDDFGFWFIVVLAFVGFGYSTYQFEENLTYKD